MSSVLSRADQWGSIKARWGAGRMNFRVDPGLYALGRPDRTSPVLVTANYRMTFDRLRAALPGLKAWILVLDTDGVNVWCAAGKGTFGTQELIGRIQASRLTEVVDHRELILPQLGAPGVAAHRVGKASGFRVIYGPVRAEDLPAFLEAGLRATPEMRLKTFPAAERMALIPVELVSALRWALIISAAFFFLGGVGDRDGYWAGVLDSGLFGAVAILAAVLAGAVLTPLLLPWLPGRAFTVKGLITGVLSALILALLRAGRIDGWGGGLEVAAWAFMTCAVAGYLAMNFTGASTYTSLSGVRKEMRWAVPLEAGTGFAGLCLWVVSRILSAGC